MNDTKVRKALKMNLVGQLDNNSGSFYVHLPPYTSHNPAIPTEHKIYSTKKGIVTFDFVGDKLVGLEFSHGDLMLDLSFLTSRQNKLEN